MAMQETDETAAHITMTMQKALQKWHGQPHAAKGCLAVRCAHAWVSRNW